jgi:hypothetical protein
MELEEGPGLGCGTAGEKLWANEPYYQPATRCGLTPCVCEGEGGGGGVWGGKGEENVSGSVGLVSGLQGSHAAGPSATLCRWGGWAGLPQHCNQNRETCRLMRSPKRGRTTLSAALSCLQQQHTRPAVCLTMPQVPRDAQVHDSE